MASSNLQSVFSFGVGVVTGWAARSLADTPQGAGVKLLEIAINAKDRVGKWAAAEGERIDDMLAEARAKVEAGAASSNGTANGATNGAKHAIRPVSGDA